MEAQIDHNNNNVSSNASNTKISAGSSSPSPINAATRAVVNISKYFKFPPGYRFRPLDHELVRDYLGRKVRNEPLPPNHMVVVDLYSHNPKDLAETCRHLGEEEWYFFTPRRRKYPKGERPNRSTGDGYWKATGSDKPIKHNEEIIGYKKALVFNLGQYPKGEKTNWIMHEYRVNGTPRTRKDDRDMKLDDWVLCRIREKIERSTRRNNQANQIQPDKDGDNENEQVEAQFESNEVIFHPDNAHMGDNIAYDSNQTHQEMAQGYNNELPNNEAPRSTAPRNNQANQIQPDKEGAKKNEHVEAQFESNEVVFQPIITHIGDNIAYDGNQTHQEIGHGYSNELPNTKESNEIYNNLPPLMAPENFYSLLQNNTMPVGPPLLSNNYLEDVVQSYITIPSIVLADHSPDVNLQGSVMNWDKNPNIVSNHPTPNNNIQGSVMGNNPNFVANHHNPNNFSGQVDQWGNTVSSTLPVFGIPRFSTYYPALERTLGDHGEGMQGQFGLPCLPPNKFQKIR